MMKEKEIQSADLFEKDKTVTITHNGQSYCLRITKANKLILTK